MQYSTHCASREKLYPNKDCCNFLKTCQFCQKFYTHKVQTVKQINKNGHITLTKYTITSILLPFQPHHKSTKFPTEAWKISEGQSDREFLTAKMVCAAEILTLQLRWISRLSQLALNEQMSSGRLLRNKCLTCIDY